MIEELLNYLRELPIKDWGGPVIAAAIALTGVIYSQNVSKRARREQREFDDTKAERDGNRTFDIAATHDLTGRFKALMDGYEARIIDLTSELKATKEELREARLEIVALRERLDAAG